MTNREKHACFNLAVTVTSVAVFVLLADLRGRADATTAFAILALWGFGPLVFLRGAGKEPMRSSAIHRRASIQGAVASFAIVAGAVLLAACTGRMGFAAAQAAMFLVVTAWMAFIVVHAASTLAQHRRAA